MPLKVLIGVNLVQLAKPFDRDTWSLVTHGRWSSSVVSYSYSALCKDIIIIFILCIAVCNCDRPVRFAAVKWTAIVNPHLLVSTCYCDIVVLGKLRECY